MSDYFGDLCDDMFDALAGMFGTTLFDINRPDYTSPVTPLTQIASGISMHVEAYGSSYSQDKVPGAEHYVIICRHSMFQAGDIISPTIPHPSLTYMTVVNADPGVDAVAIKTGFSGSLMNSSAKTALFANVMFDFPKMDSPGQPADPYQEGSKKLQAAGAVFWKRSGIRIGHRLLDSATNTRFEIINFENTTNFTIATLMEDIR